MNATFFNFSKRVNSTKVPAIAGTTFNVTLKQPTSLNNPVLRLNADTFAYNYAQFQGSYYFVSDIISIRNDLWDVYLSRDILGTYRTQILGSSLYVLRSASNYDGYIMDTKYPAKVDYTVQETQVTAPWDSLDFSGGSYVCGIIGSVTNSSVGSVSYYVLDASQLRSLLQELTGDIDFFGVSAAELSKELQKMLFNPLQYFVSCIWLPISPGTFDGQSVNLKIKYGWWEMDTYARLLRSTTPIHKTSYLALNPHPQTARGSYLNSAPYTRKFVRYMPFGTFEIDPQFFPSNTNVVLYLSIDVITGAGILRVAKEVSGGAWLSYQTLQAQVGVPIQMSQITTQFQNVINGVGSMFQGGAAGAMVAGPAGALLGAVGSIGNALDAFIPAVQSTGMNGGISSLDNDITCTHYFSLIVDEDNTNLGRPYCKYVQLSTLSGFTVCETGEINVECMADERERIASYLTGGFYIE